MNIWKESHFFTSSCASVKNVGHPNPDIITLWNIMSAIKWLPHYPLCISPRILTNYSSSTNFNNIPSMFLHNSSPLTMICTWWLVTSMPFSSYYSYMVESNNGLYPYTIYKHPCHSTYFYNHQQVGLSKFLLIFCLHQFFKSFPSYKLAYSNVNIKFLDPIDPSTSFS